MSKAWKSSLGRAGLVAAACMFTSLGVGASSIAEAASAKPLAEDYIHEPMPPGFQVVNNELEGPVFADGRGHTLYKWPIIPLRNGPAGEQKGKPTCDDHRYTETSGLMSPYPPGLELPEVATRPSCVQLWPPVVAAADGQATGKWTIVTRKDGAKQWAYDGYALYTSVLDHQSGDVLGGTKRRVGGEPGALRDPVGPAPNIPSQFAVEEVATGRLLAVKPGNSVYVWDKDAPSKSHCDVACLAEWDPVLAPAHVATPTDWAVIERSPGIWQWTFRSLPLYTHKSDRKAWSLDGSDVSGWHNVYTQKAPVPPKGFTIQDTNAGQVLANQQGRTIYVYNCNDDAIDQLSCNHPDSPQAYRLAICGRGDPAKCLENFPYVIATSDAKSPNRTWSVIDIDPKTGRRAQAQQANALHVWAYRDRPVYLCGRDQKPGDIECDAWGEFMGERNGYKAFWIREDSGYGG